MDTMTDQEFAEGLTQAQLKEMMWHDYAWTKCGCQVEIDGWCSHGSDSPFLTLGLI